METIITQCPKCGLAKEVPNVGQGYSVLTCIKCGKYWVDGFDPNEPGKLLRRDDSVD